MLSLYRPVAGPNVALAPLDVLEEGDRREELFDPRSPAVASSSPCLCFVVVRPLIGQIDCWGEHLETCTVLVLRTTVGEYMIVVCEGRRGDLLEGIAETC
jgi:hypothetical protein